MFTKLTYNSGGPGPCRCHGSPGRRPPAALGRFPVAERLGVRLDALALRAGHPEWRHGQGDGGPERGERNSRDDRLGCLAMMLIILIDDLSHLLHVWNIYKHWPYESPKCRSIYHTWNLWV